MESNNKPLRERLFGKATPLRDRIAAIGEVASGRAIANTAASLMAGKPEEKPVVDNSDFDFVPKKAEMIPEDQQKRTKPTLFDKAGFAMDKLEAKATPFLEKVGEVADKVVNGNKFTYASEMMDPAPVAEAKAPEPTFNRDVFKKAISYNESRGAKEPYKAVGPTKDLGKYQASPATLKNWSKSWLGKSYTPKEFLNDPNAQEKFFEEFNNVAERLKLTPEQAAVAWHRGWGELGTGEKETRDERFLKRLNEMMNEDISQQYLKSFADGMQQ